MIPGSWLQVAEELDHISSRGPFQLQPFIDSVKEEVLIDRLVAKLCSLFWHIPIFYNRSLDTYM